MNLENRLLENPYSTIIGLIFIVAGFACLFVKTAIELPYWFIGAMWGIGLMLLFAKDRLINLIVELVKKKL